MTEAHTHLAYAPHGADLLSAVAGFGEGSNSC